MMDSLSVATTVFDLAGRPRRLGGALGDALAVSSGESSGVSGKAFRHAGIWADVMQAQQKTFKAGHPRNLDSLVYRHYNAKERNRHFYG